MKLSAKTSPFYASWVQDQVFDMKEAKTAVVDQDFEKLAVISEHNCLKMHSVMWTSRPSIVYWNSATINCMHAIRNLQKKGEPVFFTIDAGPQIKAICLPENEDLVEKRLGEIVGVKSIMKSDLGSGPSVDINI
jgi:diphosphomevalonate decarboxylase